MLRDAFDHDAVHVGEGGRSGADDSAVATFVRSGHRALVTGNISDLAPEPDLVSVCVLARKPPSGGAQARALTGLLDRWATDNSTPYLSQHWPT